MIIAHVSFYTLIISESCHRTYQAHYCYIREHIFPCITCTDKQYLKTLLSSFVRDWVEENMFLSCRDNANLYCKTNLMFILQIILEKACVKHDYLLTGHGMDWIQCVYKMQSLVGRKST